MEFLLILFLGKPLWMWLLFMGLVVALLVFDLGVLNKDDHEIGIAESLKLSAMYITLGLAFSGFIYWQMNGEATAQYLTAFIVEKTLAMDNIFVIALIFSFFAIPRQYQHRVLFWGILGVILLRGIMIGLGATIVEHYHWVLYIFAAFLIFTGIKMLFSGDQPHDMADNKLLAFLRHRMRVTDQLHGHDFIVRQPDPRTQAALQVAAFDAILLDLALPDGSGRALLRDQRQRGNRVPVIIATARDQISERIAGLDAGADDYVVKPYDLAEIEARLRAHGRRASGDPATESRLGPLRVDRAGARLFRNDIEIRLTSREWALFDALLSARGRVLSKQVLEARLYAFDDAIEGNAVEVYVSRLRGRLEADAIQTRRGLGYLIP